MSEPLTATPDHLDRARWLVAAEIADDGAADLAAAGPDEDLRDYGLDSVRVMAVLDVLTDRGAEVDFADLVGEPTLARIGAALAAGRFPEPTEQSLEQGENR